MKKNHTLQISFKSPMFLAGILSFIILVIPAIVFSIQYTDDISGRVRDLSDEKRREIEIYQSQDMYRGNFWTQDPDTGEYWEQITHAFSRSEIAEMDNNEDLGIDESDWVWLARNPRTNAIRRFYGSADRIVALHEINAPLTANLDEDTSVELQQQRERSPLILEELNPSGGLIDCTGFNCNIYHFLRTLDNIIRFALGLAVAFVSIIFVLAGWTYITANGDSAKISRAHGMFTKSAIGFLIALSAFLLVRLFVNVLGADGNLMIDLADRVN